MNEFAFFLEHSGLNERLAPASRTILIETFKSACGGMCRERFVLNHRDLHSRNIQVDNGSFVLLDFQDARLGPPSYDLVSLVKDSYVNLSNRVETELISYYLDNSAKHTRGKIDSAAFFQGYYRCLFQRSLKAAGTFYHQSRNLGRAKSRKYIPRVLHYAISAVPKLDLAPRRKRVLETELSRLKEEIRP
jgi:hypothetical protein